MSKNIFFSLLSFAASLMLAFFVSPLILKQLGDTRYGVWALFGEVLTYYGLLDFGIRGAVNYFVGSALARGESKDVQQYCSSAFFGLAAMASAAFVATTSLVLTFEHTLLIRDGISRFELTGAAIGFLLLFCLGLPMETFAATLSGSRRVFLVSSAEIISRLISAALMYASLLVFPNLLVLCAVQLVGKLLYWTMTFINVRKHVPEAKLSFSAAHWNGLKQLFQYGGKNLAIDISWLLSNRKDVILTTIFLGPQFVATYSFGRIVLTSLNEMCSSITQVVRPNLIYHWARREYDRTYALYYMIARYSAFPVLLGAAFLVVFGRDFLSLWIGQRFVTGDWWFRTDVVMFFLLAAQVPRNLHSISWQLLFATHKQKSLTFLICAEAAVNVSLALWLVRYGTVGLAIATFIPMFVSHVLVLPLLLRRLTGVSIRRYWREGVTRPALVAVVIALLGVPLRSVMPPTTISILLLDGAILAGIGLLLGVVFVAYPEHRRMALERVREIIARKRIAASVELN